MENQTRLDDRPDVVGKDKQCRVKLSKGRLGLGIGLGRESDKVGRRTGLGWIEKHCRLRLAIRRFGQVTGLGVESQTRLDEEPDVVGK